jgi:hypothetical protein
MTIVSPRIFSKTLINASTLRSAYAECYGIDLATIYWTAKDGKITLNQRGGIIWGEQDKQDILKRAIIYLRIVGEDENTVPSVDYNVEFGFLETIGDNYSNFSHVYRVLIKNRQFKATGSSTNAEAGEYVQEGEIFHALTDCYFGGSIFLEYGQRVLGSTQFGDRTWSRTIKVPSGERFEMSKYAGDARVPYSWNIRLVDRQ